MEFRVITFYVLCHELLTSLNIREDSRAVMNNAEVMLVVLTAARFFGGNLRIAAYFLKDYGYIQKMLSESRLNRRIRAIDDGVWENLFLILAETFKKRNKSGEYILDSFPIPVCDNIRISRSKIFEGEDFRGFIPSKRRYFYGIRVHMIVAASGEPVEFLIAPGCESDLTLLKQLRFDLPPGSICYADKIYNDYGYEDLLREAAGIIPDRYGKKIPKERKEIPYKEDQSLIPVKKSNLLSAELRNFFPKKFMP